MIARGQLNSTPQIRPETSQLGRHLIFTKCQKKNIEAAGFVRDCRGFYSRSDFRGCDGYAGDRGSGCISDRAADCRACFLRAHLKGTHERHHQEDTYSIFCHKEPHLEAEFQPVESLRQS